MAGTELDRGKAKLRKTITQRLLQMSAEDRHEKSIEVCRRLCELERFRHAATIMLYMPLPSEVDVTPAAMRAFQLGATVCVPKVDWRRRDMSAVEVARFDDTEMDTDEHGIRVPRGGRIVVPEVIDLIIIPGLAFDVRGNRLGRGAGYYDRFLSRLQRGTPKVAVCFDEQIVDDVPVAETDVRVDLVVSDRRASRTGRVHVR